MLQVIIYQNPNQTNVCVCYPTERTDINSVLAKDCPSNAIIVDDSTLPQGTDAHFFNAWELNETTVTVNFTLAQAQYLTQYNSAALKIVQQRQLNTLAGIDNLIDDATWLANINSDRKAISLATNTEQLLAIKLLTP